MNSSTPTLNTTQNTERYTLGDADQECRYPVLVAGQRIGLVFRWHGAWFAVADGQSEEVRVAAGRIGGEAAARYLVDEFDAGRITPESSTEAGIVEASGTFGPTLLLHPRMPATARNVEAATLAMAGLSEYLWTPMGGYPGADNPWVMACQLCDWQGPRYWSHLRGRNGNPASPYRHPGCIDAAQVRARITAYQK
ncbi:hypothetical protein QMK19_34010 [Streptomyces sp. H10-C2]|uniref:hypothetical protein n=1 Tax=unclassified Streptomyces TaxID=2593676 RepID=UPI0024BB8A14|nr:MULTISPECIES: hypothetical protein [unclassified Streptomyces]MDJ0345564.1 hypothetical protein [Streptomyces sp. PH10-H1]MDJ0374510.1 hypothetical protein [Streptomyces sp. H10-C2]